MLRLRPHLAPLDPSSNPHTQQSGGEAPQTRALFGQAHQTSSIGATGSPKRRMRSRQRQHEKNIPYTGWRAIYNTQPRARRTRMRDECNRHIFVFFILRKSGCLPSGNWAHINRPPRRLGKYVHTDFRTITTHPPHHLKTRSASPNEVFFGVRKPHDDHGV